MSLLDNLSYNESKSVLGLSCDDCDYVARLARLRDVSYQGEKSPGAKLLNDLNMRGCSAHQFRQFLSTAIQNTRKTLYRPNTKIAILIGNTDYENLSKLATPITDCDLLANSLRSLGFITVTIKNVTSVTLKHLLDRLFSVIPEDCYSFIFYAGHGFELCNIKYMLYVDCPSVGVEVSHCISENWLLSQVAKCKPQLCLLVMDMCRVSLDRETNPSLYKQIPNIEEYKIDNTLFIIYSTQSSMSAYEMVQIECSKTIDNMSYMLKTGDTEKLVRGTSQYVTALCTHLEADLHVGEMLDKVHEDLENAPKKQTPIKVQSGVAKRSLHDVPRGDVTLILKKIKEILEIEEYRNHCDCY